MAIVHIETCPVCGNRDFSTYLDVRDHSITGESFHLLQCRKCTLVFTQDHPDEAGISRYYASDAYISHSDTREGLVNRLYHQVRAFMLDKKKSWVERNTQHVPGRLLDVGCGTGYFTHHMQRSGWQVKGLEPDENARAIAHSRFGLDISSTHQLFSLSETFDVITLWHVLEHVHQLNAYLEKFREILDQKGILLIAVPNYTSRDARTYGSDWAAYDVPRHLWHFSPASMHYLMKKHGYRIGKKYGMIFDPIYVSMLSEKYRQNRMGAIRGGFQGILSNLSSLGDIDRASSIVYICKKSS